MAAQEIGALFVNLAMNTASFDAQLKKTAAEVQSFGGKIQGSLSQIVGGMKLLGIGLASLGITEAIKAVGSWAESMSAAGEKAVLLSQSLGIPLQKLVELEGVFQLTAGSIDGASATILKLNKNVADAMVNEDQMRQNFAAIGITLQDLATKGRDPVEMLKLLADRFLAYENDAVKSAVFTKLLGKSWQEVVGILSEGSAGIEKLVAQANRIDPAATAAKEAGNRLDSQFDVLKKTITALSNEAFVLLEGEIAKTIKDTKEFIEQLQAIVRWANSAGEELAGLGRAARALAAGDLAALGQALAGLGGIGIDPNRVVASAPVPPPLGPPEPAKPKVQPVPKGGGGGGGGDRVSQWRDELDQMLIAERKFFKDNKKDELAFWQEKLTLTAEGSKEWLSVRKTIYDLEKALALKRRDDLIADAEHESQMSDELFNRNKQRIGALLATEQLSAQGAIDAEKALVEQKWALDEQYYAKKKAAAEGDTDTLDKLNKQQELDHEKHLTTLEGLNQKKVETMFTRLKALADDFTNVLGNAFSSAFDKIADKTFKLKDAIGSLLKDLGRMIANRAFKALLGGESGESGILGGLLGKLATRLVGVNLGGGSGLPANFGGPAGDFATNASGGSYRVGGVGAIDSKLVAFRASPGELVDVTPASQRGGAGAEIIRIDLNPSEAWVSGVADQRIVTRSGQIIDLAVRQSQKTVARNFAGMTAETQARQM